MKKELCIEGLNVMKSMIKGFIINYLKDNPSLISKALESMYHRDEDRDMDLCVQVDTEGDISVYTITNMEHNTGVSSSEGIVFTLDSRKGYESEVFVYDPETGEESTYAEGGVLYLEEHEDYIFSMLDYFVGNAVDNYFGR